MEWLIVIVLFAMSGYTLTKRKYKLQNQLKKCESPIEEKIVKKLYDNGYKPYTQTACGKYRIDVSVVYRGRKYAIECDGEAYHSTPEQIEHDKKKDRYLEKNRWRVIRLKGKEIHNDIDWCLRYIEAVMKKN